MADGEENTDKIRGKRDTNICWKWDDTKTERILEISKAYKRQKLGEGLEWDSDKVVLLEHARSVLGEQWCEDFGKSKPSTPQKPVEEMSKKEYQKYIENLKEFIALCYCRVTNCCKTLKTCLKTSCLRMTPKRNFF